MNEKIEFSTRLRQAMKDAVPTQDKVQVLADWLKIEPEVLRFGEAVRKSVQAHRQRWDEGVGYLERETFDAFLQLPAPQRKLIREVILTFAKVHGEPADASALTTDAERGALIQK